MLFVGHTPNRYSWLRDSARTATAPPSRKAASCSTILPSLSPQRKQLPPGGCLFSKLLWPLLAGLVEGRCTCGLLLRNPVGHSQTVWLESSSPTIWSIVAGEHHSKLCQVSTALRRFACPLGRTRFGSAECGVQMILVPHGSSQAPLRPRASSTRNCIASLLPNTAHQKASPRSASEADADLLESFSQDGFAVAWAVHPPSDNHGRLKPPDRTGDRREQISPTWSFAPGLATKTCCPSFTSKERVPANPSSQRG